MKFEWDEAKNEINRRKHGLDFADGPEMFNGPMLVQLDTRQDYGEDRWLGIGFIRHIVAVIVYTERDKGQTIRLISLRKALKYEQKRFEESL